MAQSGWVPERHYQNFFMDNARWAEFKARPNDILVCTSYKAGTTWTQMICALLVFGSEDFGTRLSDLSIWLDMKTKAIDEVLATYEAQTHRRIVKTHTPLDGIPWFPEAQYVYVGRDPRDLFLSMCNHNRNMNMEVVASRLGPPPERPEPIPSDVNELFQAWLTRASFPWEKDGWPFWSHFHHLETFWERRHEPNVVLLHYQDLLDDLEGEFRRLADFLEIEVDEAALPPLVEAATFASMKSKADEYAPNAATGVWKDNARFFNRGESGQWKSVLAEESLALYESVKLERLPEVAARWLEEGSRSVGDPKSL